MVAALSLAIFVIGLALVVRGLAGISRGSAKRNRRKSLNPQRFSWLACGLAEVDDLARFNAWFWEAPVSDVGDAYAGWCAARGLL